MQINFPSPAQAAITLAGQAIVAGAFSYGKFTPLLVTKEDIELKGSDYMGVPTLTSLAFQYNNIRIQFEECIITVNQEKNIVTTPMQGRDGTVKEYISDGDYTISVDAAVCSYIINKNDATNYQTSQAYPISELEDVIAMFKIKDALEVQSDFMMLFGIKNIVIKSYGMVQETHSNRQAFTLQMLSDTPYEIKIKQDASINK
ncbi:hypothetical protein KU05112810_190041 [Flavobacterium psychrophilum]|uniref:DUF6046 domain-containing protein n=1 Tax=Flavobacterium psychrophilum TaxID=96345 RepID=UPI000B7C21BB|nr:DUF6046 domain-containing protein [Flavobacterium psychrophilum]SNB07435.1 hypothetical protein KU05112810_190041 [Flavobacterium psychrophilum]